MPEAVLGVALDQVLDRVSDGFLTFDRDWRYTFVNRAAEAYIGRPRESLLGKVIWKLYPDAAGSELERVYRSAAAGSEVVELEMLTPVKNRWVAQRLYPTDRGLMVSFRDVTELKLASDALRVSEARWRAVFENSVEGIALTKPDGSIVAMNPAGCRMLGRSEEEIRVLGRAGIVDAGDPRVATLIEERRRTGRVVGEINLLRADGTPFPVKLSSRVFHDAAGVAFTSMSFRDLSEARRAEDARRLVADAGVALQASLDLDRTVDVLVKLVVPRLADVCFLALVESGRVQRVVSRYRDPGLSEAVRALEQPAPEPEIPRPLSLLGVLQSRRSELMREVSDEWLVDAARSPEHLQALRAIAPSSVLLVPLVARSEVVGVLGLMSRSSARRYDEKDLELAQEIAARAALGIDNARLYAAALDARRQRDDVLAVVSHDLRNPLNAIALNARILGKRTPSQQVEGIRAAVTRANQLVQDLLTIAAIEAGGLPLDRRPESVASIVEEVAALHRVLAEEGGIVLEVELEPGLPETPLDRHRIVQVLSNLVGNALKYTPEGGRVALRAARGEGGLRLEVIDSGPGIPAHEIPHLFDRYWQARKSGDGGIGLGLAITKSIVDAHAGTVSVESALGGGARFVLSFPAAPPE